MGKILMKALWLGRLARPDIIKPINDLATKVQSWSRGDDKKVLRLIQYIASTPHYRLVGTIQDKPDDLELRLFVDADFAGDRSKGSAVHSVFRAGLLGFIKSCVARNHHAFEMCKMFKINGEMHNFKAKIDI